KSPALHAQEYRTALATLRIGERFVRDRRGVRRERVRMLRPPRPRREFRERTEAAITRIRQRPLYLPATAVPGEGPAPVATDAAERLRAEQEGRQEAAER